MNQESGIKNKTNGFTLIELIVVVSIIGILSVLGIAGFKEYNEIQILQGATKDVATMLNQAKSRALSQVKLGGWCASNSLSGYRVLLSNTGVTFNKYRLEVVCGSCGNTCNVVVGKTLPRNITFDAGGTSPTVFFFPVLEGGVETGGQIVLSGYGRTETITIDSVGGVKIQ